MALLCSVRRWRYIVLVTITVHTVIAFRCMFDIVKPRRVVQTNISYLVIEDVCSNDADRCKRHASNRPIVEDLFQPIRIHAHFSSSTEINIDAVQRTRLRAVISRLVTISAHIFSVVPVDGPLLLGRSGCSKVSYTGVNTNRCATAKIGYHAEYCIDAFEIPAEHLEGLYIWNSEDPEPMLTVFDAGNGLVNTDYIIYIQSSYTSACLQGGLNVIAYASHCQLDQHGRPIAGYINICPQMLSDENYDEEKIYWTALHELFHALGFSADLFPSFQRCTFTERSNALSCEPYSSSVVKLIHGAYRLVTPKVSRLSSQHFGCHLETDVFGPMLQTLSGVVSSHWDAAFMHGSIMMPTITSPHLMLIDNITLAIFEDSGWYRVNYTCADNFIWGQGRGCDFALNPHCDDAADGVYFCRGSSRGCHYLHQDKATCDTTPFLHSCRIYRPNAQDNCQTESQSQVVDAAEDETFGETSRCFVSNLTKVSDDEAENGTSTSWTGGVLVGRCYEHRCDHSRDLFVKPLHSSQWIFCPFNEVVTVPGYVGHILCPPRGVLCISGRSVQATVTYETHMTTTAITSNSTLAGRHSCSDVIRVHEVLLVVTILPVLCLPT